MTNFEKIKQLTVDEMAHFLDDTQRNECESLHVIDENGIDANGKFKYQSLVNGWRNWLNSPSEE